MSTIMFPVSMNLPPSVVDPLVAQPTFNAQPTFPIQSQWVNSNNSGYGSYQLPLQLSQYYNVFPADVPSTKTSWTFPNGCVTSNIVKFTGLPTPSYPVGSIMHSQLSEPAPVKRKSLPLSDEVQPSKIFITEEKMTARMNEMHISNEYVSYDRPADETVNISEMDEELPEVPPDDTFKPKLIVCDELKSLRRDIDSIIPEPLIPHDKASTALVIWRPPVSFVKNDDQYEDEEYTPRSSVIITDITDRPDLENNNISTIDLNSLMIPPKIEYPPESMEVMEL